MRTPTLFMFVCFRVGKWWKAINLSGQFNFVTPIPRGLLCLMAIVGNSVSILCVHRTTILAGTLNSEECTGTPS